MTSICKLFGHIKYISPSNRKCLSLKHVKRILSINSNYTWTHYRSLNGTVKHFDKKEKHLSSSSIIVQDGDSLFEMPCVVQIINGDFEISSNGKTDGGNSYEGLGIQCHHELKASFKKMSYREESELASLFTMRFSVQEIFDLLNTCPEDEITPPVTLAVIRRIFHLENNVKYRNEAYNMQTEDSTSTYIRSVMLRRLIEIICSSTNPQIIVDTLRTMRTDTNEKDQWSYLEHLCNECIIMASDGRLTVNQVCEVVKALQSFGNNGKEYAEKAWVGIYEEQISENEIANIMSILPLVKNSRMYLYNIVERKISLFSHNFNTSHIYKIASSLMELKFSSPKILGIISRWTNSDIKLLAEDNLRYVVYVCTYLEYTDENIQKAINHYLKVNRNDIEYFSLVFTILEYCNKMRIKDPVILDIGSDYYIKHVSSIPPFKAYTIMNCFGNLAYTPDNSSEYFKIIEHQMNVNFSQFAPPDILNMFLACLYVKRYPLNVVNKVFNANFYDRVWALDAKEFLSCREKMMIIDTVMTLESPEYKGPLLNTVALKEVTIVRDARVTSYTNKIKPYLSEIFGNKNVSLFQSIPSQHPVSLFSIDCTAESLGKLDFTFLMKKNKYGFLILLPEYFDITETHLLGPHALRKRIIEHFDFKVVGLRYRIINELLIYPEKLKDYLKAEIGKVS